MKAEAAASHDLNHFGVLSHRTEVAFALLAFAHLTFALLSHSHCCLFRTVGICTSGFALVSFALLSFALLSGYPYAWPASKVNILIRKCFFKNTLFLRGPTQIYMNRFCRAPREDPKARAEHFFLPQTSSKLSTSTTTVQNECKLKSAPICSPHRQFGAETLSPKCAPALQQQVARSANVPKTKCPQPHFLQTKLLGRVILLNNFGSFIDGEKDRLRCVRAFSRVLVRLSARCDRCHRHWLNLGPPPWRQPEMRPNCPAFQERLCLSSWNRHSAWTAEARKNRTEEKAF